MNVEKLRHSARGGKWHSRTIKYMLENPLYKRIAHYKGSKVKNKELALIQEIIY